MSSACVPPPLCATQKLLTQDPQTELAISTHVTVSETHAAVSETRVTVSKTHATAFETHAVVSKLEHNATKTHTMVSEIHRAVVTGQGANGSRGLLVSDTRILPTIE